MGSVPQPSSNVARRALLYWRDGFNPGTTHVVPAGMSASIGRDPTCAISIYDKSLSRNHAVLASGTDGKWVVHDPGSANGTLVNGKKVRQATVKHGDNILIGRIQLHVYEGDAGDPSVRHLEGLRLAIRKKLVSLSDQPQFLIKNLEHRLQPWMRETKVMLVENHFAAGEQFEAFSIGTAVLSPEQPPPQGILRVRFLDLETPIDVPFSKAALLIPEIEPIGYLAGRIGKGGVPLDAHTWGQRRMVVLEDHESNGQLLSMGHIGKLDILAVGSGEFDLERVLPIRLLGVEDRAVGVEIGRLGRVVDEFQSLP